MAELPVLKLRQVLSALSHAGFTQISQKGSHLKFRRGERTVIVPHHDEIRKGTLACIIRQTGLTREEFILLLE